MRLVPMLAAGVLFATSGFAAQAASAADDRHARAHTPRADHVQAVQSHRRSHGSHHNHGYHRRHGHHGHGHGHHHGYHSGHHDGVSIVVRTPRIFFHTYEGARWSVGAAYPYHRHHARYRIVNHHRYGLPAARPGHYWVRHNNDALLVAFATGLIAGVAFDACY